MPLWARIRNYVTRNRTFFESMLAIGLPVAAQQLLTTSVHMVDTFMVSTQGESALAAVGLAGQFSSLFFSFYWGFASAGTLFFAQYWGAKNEDGIASAYGIVVSCMGAVAAVFTALALLAPRFVLGVYTDDPELQRIGASYLGILGFSFPAQVLTMALSCLMRSTEKVRPPLYGSIASIVTNTSLNWVLIYGHLGAPALGVRGAAIASVAAMYVNLGVLYAFGFADRHSLATRFRRHFAWTRALVKEYLGKAAPMIGNEVLYGIGQVLINMVMGRQGPSAVAAMSLYRILEGMIFAFFIGLANASSVMVGKQVGAGELREGYRDGRRFSWICPLVTLALCLLVLSLIAPLRRLFGLSAETGGYIAWMMAVYAAFGPLRTCSYLMNTIFRAGGEPVVGAVFEIGTLFLISVPVTWLCGMVLRLPFVWVFSAMYLEEFLKLGIGIWYLRSGRWIKPVTGEGRAALDEFHAWLSQRKRRDAAPQAE